jgi:hypothetical protein
MTEIDTEAVRIEVSRSTGALRITFSAEAVAVAASFAGDAEWEESSGALVADVRRWLARHGHRDSSGDELAVRVAAAVASVYLEERAVSAPAAQC